MHQELHTVGETVKSVIDGNSTIQYVFVLFYVIFSKTCLLFNVLGETFDCFWNNHLA